MPNALAARRAASFKNLPVHHRAQSLDDEAPPADGEQQGADKLVSATKYVGPSEIKLSCNGRFQVRDPGPRGSQEKSC
jgi:hypothetical protein